MRVTENEVVERHHQLNGHEFEQTPGESEGQGSLACCSLQGRKELDTTDRVNTTNSCPHGAADYWLQLQEP